MKNLMRKELVLAMHPASVLFLLLSAMLLIPNYPYYVICFYTCLGTFFICLTGRENRDIEFTALLPVRKTDLVRARVFTVMLMQLAQLVIAVPFAVFSSRVSAENLVGMDANTAFFGFALVLYGVFNLVFFRNYYRDAFTSVPLGRYLLNTVFFAVVTTALMVVVITLSAYAFARMEFRGKNLLFTLFLSLMMIPTELVVITNYATITGLELRNTFTGLILPSVTSVFYIYLLKENFEQVPDELYRAAKVDGTSDFKYLWKVMLPICRPTLVTIIILKVIECWNSYVWPRLITDDPNYFLVSNGIQEIRENGFGRENIPAMMAAVVVISVPLILLFFLFRKKIMAGVSRGGIKG